MHQKFFQFETYFIINDRFPINGKDLKSERDGQIASITGPRCVSISCFAGQMMYVTYVQKYFPISFFFFFN